MKTRIYPIILDVRKSNEVEMIELVQGDLNTNIFEITLKDGEEIYPLENTTVQIVFRKPDGLTVIQDGEIVATETVVGDLTVTERTISCTVKTNTISAVGRVTAEVQVSDLESNLLTSQRFRFHVRKSLLSDDVIESTNEFPLLIRLIGQVEALDNLLTQKELDRGEQLNALLVEVEQTLNGFVGTQSDIIDGKIGEINSKLSEVDTNIGDLIFDINGIISGIVGAEELRVLAEIEREKNSGFYFTPSVNTEGIISFTNNGDLPNPPPISIKGKDGDTIGITHDGIVEALGFTPIDELRVKTDVPVGAKFTDTVYAHPGSHPASMIVESTARRFVTDTEKSAWSNKWNYNEATIKAVKVSNAVDSDTVGGKTVGVNVPANAIFTDTDTTYSVFNRTTDGLVPFISGTTTTKYLREDGTWVIPPNTNTTYSEVTTAEIDLGTASTLRAITARRLKYAVEKWQTDTIVNIAHLNKAAGFITETDVMVDLNTITEPSVNVGGAYRNRPFGYANDATMFIITESALLEGAALAAKQTAFVPDEYGSIKEWRRYHFQDYWFPWFEVINLPEDFRALVAEEITSQKISEILGYHPVADNLGILTTPTLYGSRLKGYVEELTILTGDSINLLNSNTFYKVLSGETTFAILNPLYVKDGAHSFTLIIKQPTTPVAVTWFSGILWQGGEAPDIGTASKTYIFTFLTIDKGTSWLGTFGGEF